MAAVVALVLAGRQGRLDTVPVAAFHAARIASAWRSRGWRSPLKARMASAAGARPFVELRVGGVDILGIEPHDEVEPTVFVDRGELQLRALVLADHSGRAQNTSRVSTRRSPRVARTSNVTSRSSKPNGARDRVEELLAPELGPRDRLAVDKPTGRRVAVGVRLPVAGHPGRMRPADGPGRLVLEPGAEPGVELRVGGVEVVEVEEDGQRAQPRFIDLVEGEVVDAKRRRALLFGEAHAEQREPVTSGGDHLTSGFERRLEQGSQALEEGGALDVEADDRAPVLQACPWMEPGDEAVPVPRLPSAREIVEGACRRVLPRDPLRRARGSASTPRRPGRARRCRRGRSDRQRRRD